MTDLTSFLLTSHQDLHLKGLSRSGDDTLGTDRSLFQGASRDVQDETSSLLGEEIMGSNSESDKMTGKCAVQI